jgi:hypothetical protein
LKVLESAKQVKCPLQKIAKKTDELRVVNAKGREMIVCERSVGDSPTASNYVAESPSASNNEGRVAHCIKQCGRVALSIKQ